MWSTNLPDMFSKNPLISNLMQGRAVVTCEQKVGQRDMTRKIVAFRNFANSPEIELPLNEIGKIQCNMCSYIETCRDHWSAGSQLRGSWQMAWQQGLLRQSESCRVVVDCLLVLPYCHRVAGLLLRAAVQLHPTDGDGHERRVHQNDVASDFVQLQDRQQ